MQNIGEEICGEYLNHFLNCEFITYNVALPDTQGEMDVVGIDLEKKIIYVCEVATHTKGLQYVTNNQPDNYNRFLSKFKKDIDYAQKYFETYTVIPMLWSPVVRISNEGSKHNAYEELQLLKQKILEIYNLDLKLIINEEYKATLTALKEVALKTTSAFTSPVMRLYQIEQNLDTHLERLKKRGLIKNK